MHSPSPTDPTARAPRVPRALSSRALLQLAVAGALTLGGCGGTAGGPAVRVVIPPGASFATATDSLARRHVVGSPKLFRLYAKLTRRDRALKPGTYLLKPGTSWNALLDALTQGKGLVHTLTIPEGWALSQIVPALARSLGAPVESVRVAAADTALRHELDLPTPTLEGYLFPDTYTFPDGTTPRQAVTMMVRRFEQAWTPEWSMRIDTLESDVAGGACVLQASGVTCVCGWRVRLATCDQAAAARQNREMNDETMKTITRLLPRDASVP